LNYLFDQFTFFLFFKNTLDGKYSLDKGCFPEQIDLYVGFFFFKRSKAYKTDNSYKKKKNKLLLKKYRTRVKILNRVFKKFKVKIDIKNCLAIKL
jgi:hypothetical protein